MVSLFGAGPATHFRFQGLPPERLEDLPTDYPSTSGIELVETRRNPLGLPQPIYRFVTGEGALRGLPEVGVRPFYGQGLFDYIIRPRVGSRSIGPPSEFLTLWALLFCLSQLARYHPDTWVGALDPDNSTAAVTLEHGMEVALERAPSLIAEALQGPMPAQIHAQLQQWLEDAQAAGAPGGEVAAEPDELDEPDQANAP
jgi:hypothetical protein